MKPDLITTIIIIVILLPFVGMFIAGLFAPEEYEDPEGFHYGKPQ